MTDLEYIAARMACDSVSAQEIRDTVDRLLETGTYSDEFIAIMDNLKLDYPRHIEQALPANQACGQVFTAGHA